MWDLFVPEVNEETGKLYYSNDYLGITIDFWPIVLAGSAVLLIIFLLVNGFLIIPSSPASALECSGHVWCRKCPILEKLRKAKFHASKYQNLPI